MIKYNDPCTECDLNWDVHTSSMKAACRAKRVAGIQARHEAASPGPWTFESDDVTYGGPERMEYWIRIPSHRCASIFLDGVPTPEKFYFEWTNNFRDAQAKSDVVFMAASKEDVAFLLAEVARLQRLADAALANLTNTQARCSELLNECRGWRLAMGRKAVETTGIDAADTMLPVLGAVVAEVWNSNCKWGTPKDHTQRPDGTGSPDAVSYEVLAKDRCDRAGDKASWAVIADEEWAEAAAAKDTASLKTELRQCAAVAIRWLQAIEIREAGK